MRSTYVLFLAVATGCAVDDGTDDVVVDEQAVINTDPDYLYVYVNNVENLETPGDECRGDWKDLIWEMKTGTSPDVFLVQQISNQRQLDELVGYMSEHLHGIYAGVIAEAAPAPQGSPCHDQKKFQTNAIIYRVGRLEPIGGKEVWQAWANRGGECRRNVQARTKTVLQKFRDKVSGKRVSVASIHWATASGGGPDPACAERNVRELDAKLHADGFGGALTIFGGDTNETDRTDAGYRGWYELANGDRGGALGYRDVVFRMCQNGGGSLRACLDDNWTTGEAHRIDFLFARRPSGGLPAQGATHTVTFAEADAAAQHTTGSDDGANYSDHRAVRSRIFY